MAMQKFKLYVSVSIAGYGRGQYSVLDFDRSKVSADHRAIKEIEVEVDIPDIDLDVLEIEGLEAAIQKERAESQRKVGIMLERIGKLKCLTHDSQGEI